MIAVLFARRDSVYKVLPECDVWDEDRDARRWPGGCPVIVHPPCRSWGGLRHMAKAPPGEHELALFALDQVRRWGGVLEHPNRSQLWPECKLPLGDQVDEHGGYTLRVSQCWWGHRAEKLSLLYVCRVRPSDVPPVTVQLAAPLFTVGTVGVRLDGKRSAWRPDISKREREATPPDLARWLVELAGRVEPGSPRRTPAQHGSLVDQHGGTAAAVPAGRDELSMASAVPGDRGAGPARLAGHDHPRGRL